MTWSGQQRPFLVAGGKTGRILVYEVADSGTHMKHALLGHGGDVLDLKPHLTRPGLVASASADFTARLWNVLTGVCVAVFGGQRGHLDEVNAVAFCPMGSGMRLASAGADNRVLLWDLKPLMDVISASFTAGASQTACGGPRLEQFPDFATNQVHNCAVDDVAFVGNLLVSKGTNDERVWCWRPQAGSRGLVQPLFSLRCPGNRKSWMRFGLDSAARNLAIGEPRTRTRTRTRTLVLFLPRLLAHCVCTRRQRHGQHLPVGPGENRHGSPRRALAQGVCE